MAEAARKEVVGRATSKQVCTIRSRATTEVFKEHRGGEAQKTDAAERELEWRQRRDQDGEDQLGDM